MKFSVAVPAIGGPPAAPVSGLGLPLPRLEHAPVSFVPVGPRVDAGGRSVGPDTRLDEDVGSAIAGEANDEASDEGITWESWPK